MGRHGRGAWGAGFLLGFSLLAGCAASRGVGSAQDEPTDPDVLQGAAPSDATSEALRTHATANSSEPGLTARSAQVIATTADSEALRHVDAVNGFEIARPSESWTLHSGEALSTEVILVPVVLLEEAQGAQVIVQIAPAIAQPAEFAERLIAGLAARGEFTTGEVHPVDIAEDAVGFDFSAAEQVFGRVAILEGSQGKVFVLLATWPMNAPESLGQEIDAILGSVKVI